MKTDMIAPRDSRLAPQPSDVHDDTHHRFDNAPLGSNPGISLWAWCASISAAMFIIAISYGFANHAKQTAFDRNAPGPIANSLTGGPSTGPSGTAGFSRSETTGARASGGRSTQSPLF
jgi:hypothetical protein